MSIRLISPSPPWTKRTVDRRPRFSGVADTNRKRKRAGVGLGRFGEVVRNDVEFLKKKIGGGFRWANQAFRVPQVTKTVEDAFRMPQVAKNVEDAIWLRIFEDPNASVSEPRSWPQHSYPGLSGVDLLMADLKALEAYASYFYHLSNTWSKPLPEVYDPEAVVQYFNCRPHIVASRLVEVFSALMFAAIRTRTSSSDKNTNMSISQQNFGMVLKETMLKLGPTFIKVGQSLSTRPDIIGSDISKALSQLNDQIPPFPRQEAMKIIEEELGTPVESCFSYISEESVAAASFGQVYRGRTLDGMDVAIKVQRPNLLHVVMRDIFILRLGLGIIRKIAKRDHDLRLYADELGRGLVGELDYDLEAANATQYREAHSRFSFIHVPRVYQHLSRKRVLTMEWIAGESPTELLSESSGNYGHALEYSEQHKLDARRRLLDMVNKGVEATLVQLLETGFLHADPHPGNLRYTSGGQIGFLDFGLVCQMQKKHQVAMLAAIVHLVNGDWASLVEALVEMDIVRPGKNVRRVTKDLEIALGKLELRDGIPDVKFSRVLGTIISVALKYQYSMPPYFTFLLRSLASFEGLALAADKDFKTFEAAYPFVVQKLLTENSASSRRVLHSVVFNKRKEFRWDRVALFLRISSTRKSMQRIPTLKGATFIRNNLPNKALDSVNMILKLLPSKDGVVLRRLIMTANGASLVRAMVSKEAECFRQQFCRMIGNILYRWMSRVLGVIFPLYTSQSYQPLEQSANNLWKLVGDKRLKLILSNVFRSAVRDPVLMVRFCWTSLAVLLKAVALASHRFVISLSDAYIDSLSLAPKRVAVTA